MNYRDLVEKIQESAANEKQSFDQKSAFDILKKYVDDVKPDEIKQYDIDSLSDWIGVSKDFFYDYGYNKFDTDKWEKYKKEMRDIFGLGFDYMNAYAVTREYGGPEEGGWYYDAFEPLKSVKLESDMNPDQIKADLEKEFEDVPEGDISSVAGGVKLVVMGEEQPAKRSPETRPHYESRIKEKTDLPKVDGNEFDEANKNDKSTWNKKLKGISDKYKDSLKKIEKETGKRLGFRLDGSKLVVQDKDDKNKTYSLGNIYSFQTGGEINRGIKSLLKEGKTEDIDEDIYIPTTPADVTAKPRSEKVNTYMEYLKGLQDFKDMDAGGMLDALREVFSDLDYDAAKQAAEILVKNFK